MTITAPTYSQINVTGANTSLLSATPQEAVIIIPVAPITVAMVVSPNGAQGLPGSSDPNATIDGGIIF